MRYPASKERDTLTHWHQVSRAPDGDMFGATNLICGDWCAGTVTDTLRWVKCPAKTSQARNIRDYEKSSNYIA